MNIEREESKKLSFKYKLIDARKISYFEKDIENSVFKDKLNKENVPFQLKLHVSIDPSVETIELILSIKFYHKEKDKKKEIFGIKSSHKFKIRNFKNVFQSNNKKKHIIPDEVMATFLGIAISGTRGMLVVLNTNKYLKKIILPLINPLEIIKKGQK